jgi:hypothetical protein
VEQIASGGKKVEVLKKVDLSIVDGIVRTAKAYGISDIIISWKAQQNTTGLFFGNIADNLLIKSRQSVIITKIIQPLNSYRHVHVVLAPNAEIENGFPTVARKMNALLKQVGHIKVLYGTQKTLDAFARMIHDRKHEFYQYRAVNDFEDRDPITKVGEDDLYLFLSGRKQTVSYDFHVDDMPRVLNKTAEFTSFVVFYPEAQKALNDSQLSEMTTPAIQENLEKVIQLKEKLTGIFKKES